MNWEEIGRQFLFIQEQPLLFHQGLFLLLFAFFLICYSFVVKHKSPREYLIIIFSAYFYYKSSGIFIFLLLTTISVDYLFSIWLEYEKNKTKRKWILASAVLFSLSFLLYFKYKNFFISNYDAIVGTKHSLSQLILPIGISFYTFQSISYLSDIANRNIKRPVFQNYLMYMMFFPHLVAGPIVRARDFLPQLTKKISLDKRQMNEAFYLFIKGLIKKAIIADYVAQYADIVFSAPDGFSGSELILASLCYTLQIFCDFSGYTDMAIGIALLLGYRLCLNFDSPYKALNITNFWRRWHISLSSWLRDYIYIPLGGNRKGFLLQILFLFLTMLIGGFWHGADWKFIFWGAGHGILLILHKLWVKFFGKYFKSKWFNTISWLITFCCISLLWIPFRATSIESTWVIYKRIFTTVDFNMVLAVLKSNPFLFISLLIGYAATLLKVQWKSKLYNYFGRQDLVIKFLVLIVVIQLMIQMRSSVVQPFIYFQF
jgi:D-alanyl-lipoteichoic acid acyltransferase DltB (MBOAT superfamily)